MLFSRNAAEHRRLCVCVYACLREPACVYLSIRRQLVRFMSGQLNKLIPATHILTDTGR